MKPSPLFQSHDWYDAPIYYDIIFDADTQIESDFLLQAMNMFGKKRSCARILEPACGSGRLLFELGRRGHHVLGFDANAHMLAFATQRLGAQCNGSVQQGRLEDFDVGSHFDLAHCLVSTFKYVLDEAGARTHLQCVARSLVPGGIYVLGFHLTDYSNLANSRERWFGKRGGVDVICNIQTWPARKTKRLEQVRSRLTVRRRRTVNRLETHWQFRTYNARQVRNLLRAVPSLEHVATYDFHYNLNDPRSLDDSQLDCVLILRRR